MSTNVKHTPGPWGIPDLGPSGSALISAGRDGDWKGMIGYADAGSYARSPDEGRANARMMAAAPDLADALEKLLANDGSAGNYDARACIEAAEAGRAALKKAGRLP